MFSARHSALSRSSAGRAVVRDLLRVYSAGFTPPFSNCHCVLNSVSSLMYSKTSRMSKSVRAREPRNGGTGTSGAFGSDGERGGSGLPSLLRGLLGFTLLATSRVTGSELPPISRPFARADCAMPFSATLPTLLQLLARGQFVHDPQPVERVFAVEEVALVDARAGLARRTGG